MERDYCDRAPKSDLFRVDERLIDSFTEGLIEKDQFTSRIDRTKRRIADLDAKIRKDVGDVDRWENLRLAANRLRELAAAVGPEFATASWHRRREIIRTLVQGIDIDTEAMRVIFRVTQNTRGSGSDPIVVTLPRLLNDLDTLWTILVFGRLVQKIVAARTDFARFCARLEWCFVPKRSSYYKRAAL